MRSMCGADAGCLAINYQSLWGNDAGASLGRPWAVVSRARNDEAGCKQCCLVTALHVESDSLKMRFLGRTRLSWMTSSLQTWRRVCEGRSRTRGRPNFRRWVRCDVVLGLRSKSVSPRKISLSLRSLQTRSTLQGHIARKKLPPRRTLQ